MNIAHVAVLWLNFCLFTRKVWRSILMALCILCPEALLYLMKIITHDNNLYHVSIEEDKEMEDHIALFFYLFPHNCAELANYIKFIYKYHLFYKWRSHEFTIAVTRGETTIVFNPFTKVNIETSKKLMFGQDE